MFQPATHRVMCAQAVVILVLAGASACKSAKEAYRATVGPEPGRHHITIVQLALSESDFTNSALGTPKPIELRAFKDGAEVKVGRVEGYRGPKDPGLSFELDYDPHSRYEFKIEEVVLLTPGKMWPWASTEPGNWIFDGRKTFGVGSSIEFRDEKIR